MKERHFNWQTWLKCYRIYRDIRFNNFDHVAVIAGGEGMGKTTFAIKMACAIDENFSEENILYGPERLPGLLEDLMNNEVKGKVIILDEGNMFLFSREAMSGGNKMMVKLLSICRQLNICLIINVPNFFTIDTYIREHRVKSLTMIYRRGYARVYNSKYLKLISVQGSKLKNVLGVKVSYDGWFDTTYSNSFPPLINEANYLKLKNEHMRGFLQDLRDSISDMTKKNDGGFLAVSEIRGILPVSRHTITKRIETGDWEGKKIGGKWFMKRTELDRILSMECNKQKSKAAGKGQPPIPKGSVL